MKLLYSLGVFIILIFLNIIGEKFKLLIDLKRPQTTWDSEYTMMKQNTNVMYELFYTFLMMVILIMISFLFRKSIVFLIFALIIAIIVNLYINEYIHNNQNKLMKKII